MKAILNLYDECSENVEVGVGEFVVANTSEFGLVERKKYEVIDVDAEDMISIEVHEGYIDTYSIEYFDEYKGN